MAVGGPIKTVAEVPTKVYPQGTIPESPEREGQERARGEDGHGGHGEAAEAP